MLFRVSLPVASEAIILLLPSVKTCFAPYAGAFVHSGFVHRRSEAGGKSGRELLSVVLRHRESWRQVMLWHENWRQAQVNFVKWWRREGAVIAVQAPKDTPWEQIEKPESVKDLEVNWLDPHYRTRRQIYQLSRTWCGGDVPPVFETSIGPGSLGTFVGSEPGLAPDTVWYHPCIDDPDTYPEIRFDPDDYWFNVHRLLIETGVRNSKGRYFVGMPDLIENIDILAQMRSPQTLMIDMIERPRWVEKCVSQLNRVYFEAFERLYRIIQLPDGGNIFAPFKIWGPGKTAKVQCDASAMFSAEMFRRFVVPALTEQCRWLDNSMYHLDGTQAMHHLDALLEIDALDAIEWTPQSGIENGGHPRWYPLYRKILNAGKCVQAIGVSPDEVKPLLDACGAAGMYIMCNAGSESEARRVVETVNKYRK